MDAWLKMISCLASDGLDRRVGSSVPKQTSGLFERKTGDFFATTQDVPALFIQDVGGPDLAIFTSRENRL